MDVKINDLYTSLNFQIFASHMSGWFSTENEDAITRFKNIMKKLEPRFTALSPP